MTTPIDELTGHDLNRAVAEALGYDVVEDAGLFIVRGPHYAEHVSMSDTIDGAWAGADEHRFFPDYANDTNAALALVDAAHDEIGILISRYQNLARWFVIIYAGSRPIDIHSYKTGGSFGGEANNPATAICRAWLKWQQKSP